MISRKKASLTNASAAFITQLIMMVGQFAVQTVFVNTLGAEYLGANGLFNNLITFLSFAELGIGSAFSYALYKPLAEEDQETINAIMHLFKRVYNLIGILILVFGLILSYFVPWFIHGGESFQNIRFYFILYLLGTVVSYFFTYNRSLIIADQRSYIDSLNQMIFSILKYGFQIWFLLASNSYVGYLVVMIATNLLSNIAITIQSRKRYPFLKDSASKPVDPLVLKKLKQNVIGTIASKVGATVVIGTDNLLISKFIGLTVVGLYSNYALVLNSITRMLTQVFTSVIASFGNLGVTDRDNKEKQIDLFNQYTYYNAIAVFFIGLVSYAFFPPFIRLWLGSEYELSDTTLIFIVLNFVLAQFRPALNMITAYGLFWGFRVKSIVEAVVNFGLSLILVKYTPMGIDGVLLGTMLGNILVNSWWDPWILYRGAYQVSMKSYYLKYWAYLGTFTAIFLSEVFVLKFLALSISGLWQTLLFGTVVSLIILLLLLVFFSRTRGQSELIRVFKRRLSR